MQQWIEIYSKARQRALNLDNILSGFRAAGLWPVSQFEVEQRLRLTKDTTPLLRNSLTSIDILEKLLLSSSPLEATELHEANAEFISCIAEMELATTRLKRYSERIAQ
ncbi:hypothetical protein K431DRAFT_236413, partial [Polychaeton citri CBS 116435]